MRLIVAFVLFLAGCASPDAVAPAGVEPLPPMAAVTVPDMRWPDPLSTMPRGAEQNARFCSRGGDDMVHDALCGPQTMEIRSLADLRTVLRIDAGKTGRGSSGSATVINGVAVTGHSTSLSARSVSSINPRVITVRMDIEPNDTLAVAFTRGEQVVELASYDRTQRDYRFYVVAFEQACNESPRGCTPGDLLTPAIESDWTELSLYDERDVANTVFDCATCHQPDGPGTPKLLRMHELPFPWTHWFAQDNTGGRALVSDYVAAKGDEVLAGVDAVKVVDARPQDLEGLATFSGSSVQPNMFDSDIIEREVQASASGQPADNSVPGVSATWRLLFERAQRGEALPTPYHDVKVTDAMKLARATEAYRAYRTGEIEASALPDIRDVFPDDETLLAEMGMMTTPGASGEEVLIEACSPCHNARLDQSLSRARFRADLTGMDRAEREIAVQRLQLATDHPLAMPPARLRRLSAEARARAIEALRR